MQNVILNNNRIFLSGTVYVLLDVAAVDQKRLARARSTQRSASWALLGSHRLIWCVN